MGDRSPEQGKFVSLFARPRQFYLRSPASLRLPCNRLPGTGKFVSLFAVPGKNLFPVAGIAPLAMQPIAWNGQIRFTLCPFQAKIFCPVADIAPLAVLPVA